MGLQLQFRHDPQDRRAPSSRRIRTLNCFSAARIRLCLMALCCGVLPLPSKAVVKTPVPAETLARFAATPVLWIGVRTGSVPFSYADSAGEPQGFSVDLCRGIADTLRATLGLKGIQVKTLFVTSESRFDALTEGKIDIECGTTTNTEERQRIVAFTVNTFVSGARIAARVDTGIVDFSSLSHKRIALAQGTTAMALVKRRISATGLYAAMVVGSDTATTFGELQNHQADAYVNDEILLAAQVAKSATPGEFALVGPYLSIEPYALMVRKTDPALLDVANTALRTMYASGQIFTIYAKWFDSSDFRFPMNRLTRDSYLHPSEMHGVDY